MFASAVKSLFAEAIDRIADNRTGADDDSIRKEPNPGTEETRTEPLFLRMAREIREG